MIIPHSIWQKEALESIEQKIKELREDGFKVDMPEYKIQGLMEHVAQEMCDAYNDIIDCAEEEIRACSVNPNELE